jgi:hypothetical protein
MDVVLAWSLSIWGQSLVHAVSCALLCLGPLIIWIAFDAFAYFTWDFYEETARNSRPEFSMQNYCGCRLARFLQPRYRISEDSFNTQYSRQTAMSSKTQDIRTTLDFGPRTRRRVTCNTITRTHNNSRNLTLDDQRPSLTPISRPSPSVGSQARMTCQSR